MIVTMIPTRNSIRDLVFSVAKYSEFIGVVLTAVIFVVLFNCPIWLALVIIENEWSFAAIDPSDPKEFWYQIIAIYHSSKLTLLILCSLMALVAVYFSTQNNRLSTGIRMLVVAEHSMWIFFCICVLYVDGCAGTVFSSIQCTSNFTTTLANDISFSLNYVVDFARYCQFGISLSRFLAVSFDGFYFQYTLKKPLLQLVSPFILRIILGLIYQFASPALQDFIDRNLLCFPFMLTYSLDIFTNRKMKILGQSGKVSHVDVLLLKQMLSSTILNVTEVCFIVIFQLSALLFFVPSVYDPNDHSVPFIMYIFVGFSFLTSTTTAHFLRKRQDEAPSREVRTATS
ncbi:unnamed protein product, partial [Mesorhabditis belari]|uniref:Uncharacterized protein n=1 Tax=Mesorhabditis belari TaxID=2138241 RepID=A0AAF3F1X0_9BILA